MPDDELLAPLELHLVALPLCPRDQEQDDQFRV